MASERSRKAKLGRDRAVPVEAPGEERASSLMGNKKFGVDGAGESGIVVARVGDQETDGGITAGEVLRLAKHANDRAAEDARDGLDPGDRRDGFVAVFETITHPLPNQVFECDAASRARCSPARRHRFW